MKARKKPIKPMTLDELDLQLEPRVEVLALEAVTAGRSCRKVGSTQELLTVLRDEAKAL